MPFRVLTLLATALLAACTSYGPSKADFHPVDPAAYANWTCTDLRDELAYVLRRLEQRRHRLERRNALDTPQAATGLLLPPTLAFVTLVRTSEDQDFTRLAAHAIAISQAGREKKCEGIPEVKIDEK